MERIDFNVKAVPLVGGAPLSLRPGVVLRVSGSSQVQFIRIREIGKEAGPIQCEILGADGTITKHLTSVAELPRLIPDAILKYQTIMTDGEWEALTAFVELISSRHLGREQVMKLFMCLQDMLIEREMDAWRKSKRGK